jgi:hypothetical protein
LNGSYSYLDDKENSDYDSSATAVNFSPAWASERLSITPNLSWNRSERCEQDTWTDTYGANLDVRSIFLHGLLTFDVGSSYTVTTDSEDTIDLRTLIAQMQLAYSLKEFFPDYFVPALALQGSYYNNDDQINRTEDDDFTLFLTLTSSIPFAF